MNPDQFTPEQARAVVQEWCTLEPQIGEVYVVVVRGMIYRYPEIWVLVGRSTHGRLMTFDVYKSTSLKHTPAGVRLLKRREPSQQTVRKDRWMSLRAKGYAVYKGQEVRDTGSTNIKAGKKNRARRVRHQPAAG